MGTAIKHLVPDRVKLSFVSFDIWALWRPGWASECPDVKNYKSRLNPVWQKMLYSCTHMEMETAVGIKGLTFSNHGQMTVMKPKSKHSKI